jgi:hypothetical protein
MRPVVTLALGLALWPGVAAADEIFIRGGGRLTGEVIERGPDSILVDIGTGQIGLPASSVDRIVPGATPGGLYRQRAASLAPDDLEGWLALAAWARTQGLEAQARAAWENVLLADPGNVAARRALGYIQIDGQWMTREESYQARGYVLFDGAWVTSEQARASLEDRRARAEERRAGAEAEARIREAEARARVAEADAQRAETDLRRVEAEGVQMGPGYATDVGWSPWYAGNFYSPFAYSAYSYPVVSPFGYSRSSFRKGVYGGFGVNCHPWSGVCVSSVSKFPHSARRHVPVRSARAAKGRGGPAHMSGRGGSRRSR